MVWLFNIILYVLFVLDPAVYRGMVAAGSPCYIQVSGSTLPLMGLGDRSIVQPACWYDPNNTNDGHHYSGFYLRRNQ